MTTNCEEKKVFKTVRRRQGGSIIESRFNKLGKLIDKIITTNNINNKSIAYEKNNFSNSKKIISQKKYDSPMIKRKSITIKRNVDLEIKNSKKIDFSKKEVEVKKYTGPVIKRKSVIARGDRGDLRKSMNNKNLIVKRKSVTIRRNEDKLRKSISYTKPIVTKIIKSNRTVYQNTSNQILRKSVTIKNRTNFENHFNSPLRKSIVVKSGRNFKNDFNPKIRKSFHVKNTTPLKIRKSTIIKSNRNNFHTPLRKSVVIKSKNYGNDIDMSENKNYRTKNEDLEIISVKRRVSNLRGANMIRRQIVKAQTVQK